MCNDRSRIYTSIMADSLLVWCLGRERNEMKLDKQELLIATKLKRESSFVEYTFKSPAGWYYLSPYFQPSYTIRLEDHGFFMGHGGEATVRFSYDPLISFLSQKLPLVGDAIGLITLFEEEFSPMEKFRDLQVDDISGGLDDSSTKEEERK